jgi:hypothetical protein
MCTVKLEGDSSATHFFFLALLRNTLLLLSLLLLTLGKPPSVSIETLYFRVSLAQTRLKLYARCLRSSKPTFNGRLSEGCI